MRPRIFIGSSKEALEVATYVQSKLNKDFDCYVWTDDIFQHNENYLYTLLKEASLFDFGLLIATKDDRLRSRHKEFDSPRDNVLFEFGLFLGRLGPQRAFVIQQKGTKLPSDLFGITMPTFTRKKDLTKSDDLNQEIKRIKKNIKEKIKLGELSLLPSTPLAIGYFHNFVAVACQHLCSKKEVVIHGKKFTNFKMFIVLPTALDSDIKKRAQLYNSTNSLQQANLDVPNRDYSVGVRYDDSAEPTLLIYDMPTTLLGMDQAINMYLRKGHVGKSAEQRLLEERELRNFQTVLQLLIDNDPFCAKHVKIIYES